MKFIKSCVSMADLPQDDLPQVVFAGRSNVGKSSVLNSLARRKNLARVGNAPGKTSHINFFCVDEQLYLVDLPGYGYAIVSQGEKLRWARLLESYFADPVRITKGILVVDARHEPSAQDIQMAGWFRAAQVPWIVVANKVDKLKPSRREAALTLIRETLLLGVDDTLIPFSAVQNIGREELIREIEAGKQLHPDDQSDMPEG